MQIKALLMVIPVNAFIKIIINVEFSVILIFI